MRSDRTLGQFRADGRETRARTVIPQTLTQNLANQMAGGPRLPVTNEIVMKITAITSST
jgi:hypothetical protein